MCPRLCPELCLSTFRLKLTPELCPELCLSKLAAERPGLKVGIGLMARLQARLCLSKLMLKPAAIRAAESLALMM
jgi:hypothetical protein